VSRFSRRSFLGGAVGSLAVGATWPARAQGSESRVVSVTDGSLWTGDGWTDTDLDPPQTRVAIEQALVALTGQPTATEAVAALLPEIGDATQRYGIKVNCVNRHLPSHPTVVRALADIMMAAGARAENIVVFDRTDHELTDSGFTVQRGEGLQMYGTSADQVGYSDTVVPLTHGSVRLSRIVESVDHLINIPVLKNHQMAGVTLALKNHFGSIDRPELLHGPDRSCCPGIAELSAVASIRDKTRLVLIDALFGAFRSGLAARPDFAPMTLIAATDPVAADIIGQELINTRRARADLAAIDARHIREAAAAGLGSTETDHVVLELSPAVEKPKPWLAEEGCSCSAGATVLTAAAAALVARRKM